MVSYMNPKDIQQTVLTLVNKGYSDHETIRYCDDMYDATDDEKDYASDRLDELLCIGSTEYSKKYDLK